MHLAEGKKLTETKFSMNVTGHEIVEVFLFLTLHDTKNNSSAEDLFNFVQH